MTYSLITGILFGLYFAMLAMGLTLAFGVARIVNLAHGDFIVLGALFAGLLFTSFGLNPILSGALFFVISPLIGIVLYYFFVKPISGASDHDTTSLIIFFGVSELIEAVLLLLIGPSPHSIPLSALAANSIVIFGAHVPLAWIYTGILSTIVIAATFLLLYETAWGRVARAVMAQEEEASAIGINATSTTIIVLGLSVGLAGISGSVTPFIIGSVNASSGLDLTLTAFLVAVLGTIGNPIGTFIASIVFGIALALVQLFLSSWANVFPYIVLVILLLIRPNGLFGGVTRHV